MREGVPPPSTARWARAGAVALVALVAGLVGCEEAEVPVGPPRCEPAEELTLERKLKEGFRALLEEQPDAARAAFQAVMRLAPAHPEAALGLRWVGGGIRPQKAAPPPPPPGVILRANEAIPVDFPVEHTRYRFEEFRKLRQLGRARDLDSEKVPLHDYFKDRPGPPGAPGEVDLVVLHDTHTLTAREAFVAFLVSGASSHFAIDWDGTVYQLLDLAVEANHSQRVDIDARSIAIDLVNPVELGSGPGLPPEATGAAGANTPGGPAPERPVSDFVRLQRGDEVQQWGYTAAQLASLTRLLKALAKACPALPLELPKADGGGIPRAAWPEASTFRGILGHLHLAPRSFDPGAGFDWEALERGLR